MYPQPFFRKLKGYAFDPSFSSTLTKRQSNEVIYKIKWENTVAGPRGEYIDVVDYDPSRQCFYDSLDLEAPFVLADHGLTASEGDPRFHQQQVYAVIMSVINQFEKALGRKLIWSKIKEDKNNDNKVQYQHQFVPHLRVYPHAMRQQNAYYSPDKNALLFGYFQASNSWDGNNVPGSAIFTCLSPDIVAHETTHAILDSIHPFLTQDTNTDMLAFHEGFADIIALLQRFTFRTVVEEQIRNSKGDLLSPENLLGDLAIQFGQAVSGNRRALRSYLVEKDRKGNWGNIKPDPSLIHTETDPHARGGLLVAAIFDAFARLYRYKVADLIRLASNGSGILAQGEIDPDLVKRLSQEACEIAEKLMLVCIRALDYCPPADLTFGDYLRALITADLEHNPDDESGVRYALMEAFRQWGIVPEEVNTFSVEALKWKSPGEYFVDESKLDSLKRVIKYCFDPRFREIYPNTNGNPRLSNVLGYIERILRENDRGTIFQQSQELSAFIHDLFFQKLEFVSNNPETLLGMSFARIDYTNEIIDDTGKETEIKVSAMGRNKFQVYKCRPLIVPDPHTGNSSKVMLIMFLQKVYVDLSNSPHQGFFPGNEYAFRGGCSLIVDMANYEIKYIIAKSVVSSERLFKQLDYAVEHISDEENNALLMQGDEPFAALHFH
jgi:hypothetical protein